MLQRLGDEVEPAPTPVLLVETNDHLALVKQKTAEIQNR